MKEWQTVKLDFFGSLTKTDILFRANKNQIYFNSKKNFHFLSLFLCSMASLLLCMTFSAKNWQLYANFLANLQVPINFDTFRSTTASRIEYWHFFQCCPFLAGCRQKVPYNNGKEIVVENSHNNSEKNFHISTLSDRDVRAWKSLGLKTCQYSKLCYPG